MDALVIYESMFGNTEAIARAVLEGLSPRMRAEIVEVSTASTVLDEHLQLLVVGGPTHAFGLSRRSTREDAAREAGHHVPPARVGLREWIDMVEAGGRCVPTAIFDTRVDRPRLPGSAAAAAQKRLKRLGFTVIDRPTSFYVQGKTGPLVDGELERATAWAESLGAEFMPAV